MGCLSSVAVPTAHPRVARAVVIAREDGPGGKRLAGYVTPAAAGDDDPALADVLRQHAAQRLPEHLVPTAIVILDEIPLTPAGKIDRAALPIPGVTVTAPGGRDPMSAREELLCQVFADVLRVDRVGPRDSFFDLGGHSLLATQLVSRIRTVLGVEADIRMLFDAPTPAGLAGRLVLAGPARLALTRRDRAGRVPLSFAQQRLWFLAQLEGPSAAYNNPIAVRLSGDLDVAALGAALGDVIARHEVLRTVFPAAGGRPCQRVLAVDEVGWELPVTVVPDAEVAAVIAETARQPFDLAARMPLRARLISAAGGGYALVVVLHHIATDGWSMRLLARDVSVAYAARREGRVPGWAPLPVQYGDYAIWQRELLGDEDDPGSVLAGRSEE